MARASVPTSRGTGASRGTGPFRRTAAVAAALTACAVAACAGPTPDAGSYRRQAGLTSRAMVSILQTATTAARAELDGRSFAPYTDTTITDAESDAGAVQTTFDSRQPPDPGSDRLREAVDGPLSDSVDGLQALRIAQRRGDGAGVRQALDQLSGCLSRLQRLAAEISS